MIYGNPGMLSISLVYPSRGLEDGKAPCREASISVPVRISHPPGADKSALGATEEQSVTRPVPPLRSGAAWTGLLRSHPGSPGVPGSPSGWWQWHPCCPSRPQLCRHGTRGRQRGGPVKAGSDGPQLRPRPVGVPQSASAAIPPRPSSLWRHLGSTRSYFDGPGRVSDAFKYEHKRTWGVAGVPRQNCLYTSPQHGPVCH